MRAPLFLGLLALGSCSRSNVSSLDLNELEPSVVTIHNGHGQGTGFFVAPGIVLTNRHVVQMRGVAENLSFIFSRPRSEEPALLTYVDPELDLAVLRCAPGSVRCAEISALELGRGADIAVGAAVHAFGSPAGLENTWTRGIISHRSRSIKGHAHLQTDLAINGGNSGGPLFDSEGRVIGVMTAKLINAEGIAFALPIEYAVDGPNPILARHLRRDREFSAAMKALIAEASTAEDLANRPVPQPAFPQPEPVQRPARTEVVPWVAVNVDPSFALSQPVRHPNDVLQFRLTVPLNEPLRAGDRFELLEAPHPSFTEQNPAIKPLPSFSVVNTLDRPEQNTRTYLAKIEPGKHFFAFGRTYHLRFQGKKLSASFQVEH
jgi:hypothetical protein